VVKVETDVSRERIGKPSLITLAPTDRLSFFGGGSIEAMLGAATGFGSPLGGSTEAAMRKKGISKLSPTKCMPPGSPKQGMFLSGRIRPFLSTASAFSALRCEAGVLFWTGTAVVESSRSETESCTAVPTAKYLGIAIAMRQASCQVSGCLQIGSKISRKQASGERGSGAAQEEAMFLTSNLRSLEQC